MALYEQLYEQSSKRVILQVEGSPANEPSMLTFRVVATIPDQDAHIRISGAYRSSLTDALESVARELGERLKRQIEQNHAKSERIAGLSADLGRVKERIKDLELSARVMNDFGSAEKREIAEQLTRVLEQLRED